MIRLNQLGKDHQYNDWLYNDWFVCLFVCLYLMQGLPKQSRLSLNLWYSSFSVLPHSVLG